MLGRENESISPTSIPGLPGPYFAAFFSAARFSAHRFLVAAMMLARPAAESFRLAVGPPAMTGTVGSDSPRILAHLAFCARAIFRLATAENLERFFVVAGSVVMAVSDGPPFNIARSSAIRKLSFSLWASIPKIAADTTSGVTFSVGM